MKSLAVGLAQHYSSEVDVLVNVPEMSRSFPDDVADYRDVDPRIGTLADFDEMTSKLKEKGIKVIVDIVPNHCSEDHVWFQEAIKSPVGSEARSKFIFRDGEYPCMISASGKSNGPPRTTHLYPPVRTPTDPRSRPKQGSTAQ
jgi:glycosidase